MMPVQPEKRRRSLLRRHAGAIACAVTTAAALIGADTSAAAAVQCQPGPGTTTIAQSREARVFEDELDGNDYACLYSVGVPRLLSSAEHFGYRLVRFAGSYVAFVQTIDTADDHLGVVNMRTGRAHEYLEAAPIRNAVCPEVRSLVLRFDGAIAWIATNFKGPYCLNPPGPVVEVRLHDRRGLRVLDRGLGIAPGSLRLKGSRVRWVDRGHRRSATIL